MERIELALHGHQTSRGVFSPGLTNTYTYDSYWSLYHFGHLKVDSVVPTPSFLIDIPLYTASNYRI
jgi:hypothetical protein